MTDANTDLHAVRRAYADVVRDAGNLQHESLVQALARVPRERFFAAGPWKIIDLATGSFSYQDTVDADPRHLYADVLVALDPARFLNNGHPSSLASWIDALAPARGEHVVHFGCGTGYYTALMADMVGPGGKVTAVEVDDALAASARANLAAWPQVTVVHGDSTRIDPGPCDAILVNAGVTHPPDPWLARTRERGRMLMPLTHEEQLNTIGGGAMLLLSGHGGAFDVRMLSPTMIFSCVGARDPLLNDQLRAAFARGGAENIRSLTLNPDYAQSAECWFHSERFCYSTQARIAVRDT
jgi:protein-L-isoaspartate(D-aspartate) O-methyltransferase